MEFINYTAVLEKIEPDGVNQNTLTKIEVEDGFQITNKTNPDNGVQMTVNKADLDNLVREINDSIQTEGGIQKINRVEIDDGFVKISEGSKLEDGVQITEKIYHDDGFQIMEEKTDLDCMVQVKNGESKSEVDIKKISGIESKGRKQEKITTNICRKQEKITTNIGSELGDQKQVHKGIKPLVGDRIKNSTGNSGTSISGVNVPSRYLWAATGSCHDLCKFGHKHGSKSKERRLVWERVPAKGENSNGMAMGMIKKEAHSKSSAFLVQKRSTSQTAINNLQTGSSSKKRSESRSRPVRKCVGGKMDSKPPIVSFCTKNSDNKTSIMNTEAGTNLRRSSNKNNWTNARVLKPEQTSNDDACHEKILHMIEPAVDEEPGGSTLSGQATHSPLSAQILSIRSPPCLPPSSGMSRIPFSCLPPTSNIYAAASPGNKALGPMQPKVRKFWVASRSPSPSPSPSSSPSASPSPSYMSESSSSHRCKVRPRICSLVASENNFISPRKLRFRTDKVLELPQQQVNAPRRLKFRRPRLLGEVEAGQNDCRKRTMKRKGVYGNQQPLTKGDSESVVLRHRMVEGKKMMRHLYNNVIEETASQLAHTRKSKVKALVGAFETVISLDSESVAISHPR